MSTALLVMTPFVLLAIVSSLCFVGCWLPSYDMAQEDPADPPVFKYSDDTVLSGESDRLLAYWRLNEESGPTAVNAANPGTADGKYKSQMFPADPLINSAEAPGTLNFGQPGILAGDLQSPFTAGSTRQPSIFVDGGFVSVDWHSSSRRARLTVSRSRPGSTSAGARKSRRRIGQSWSRSKSNGDGLNGFGIIAADGWDLAGLRRHRQRHHVCHRRRGRLRQDHHLVATYADGAAQALRERRAKLPDDSPLPMFRRTVFRRPAPPPGSSSGPAGRN